MAPVDGAVHACPNTAPFSNKRHHPPNPTALLPPYFQPTTRNTRATGATDLLPPYFSHQQETPPPPPTNQPPYFQPPPTSSRDTATDLLRLADVLEVAEVLLDDVHVGNQRVHNVAPRPVQRLQDPKRGERWGVSVSRPKEATKGASLSANRGLIPRSRSKWLDVVVYDAKWGEYNKNRWVNVGSFSPRSHKPRATSHTLARCKEEERGKGERKRETKEMLVSWSTTQPTYKHPTIQNPRTHGQRLH